MKKYCAWEYSNCSAFHFLHNQSVFSIVLHNQSVFSIALSCSPICIILPNQLVCPIVMSGTTNQYLIQNFPAQPNTIMYHNIISKQYLLYCSSVQPVLNSVFSILHTMWLKIQAGKQPTENFLLTVALHRMFSTCSYSR